MRKIKFIFDSQFNFNRVFSLMTVHYPTVESAVKGILGDAREHRDSFVSGDCNESLESTESKLTSIETELLPQLRNFRIENEERLLAELDEVSRENSSLRAQLEKRKEKVRALFEEYTKLKPAYIEQCKKSQMNQAPAWTKNLRPASSENWEKTQSWTKPERKADFNQTWNVKHVDSVEPEAHDAEDTFRPKWKTSAAVARNHTEYNHTSRWNDTSYKADENRDTGYSRWSNNSASNKATEWADSGRDYKTQNSQSNDVTEYTYTRWNSQPKSSQSSYQSERWNKTYEEPTWEKEKHEPVVRADRWQRDEPAPSYDRAKSWNTWKKAETEEPSSSYEARESSWNTSAPSTSETAWNREYYRAVSPPPGLEDSIPRHLLDRFQSGRTIPKPPSSYPVSSNFIRGSLSGDAAMLS